MWIQNKVFREDLDQLMTCDYIPWDKLCDKTVLVTGATGLIGYNVSDFMSCHQIAHIS